MRIARYAHDEFVRYVIAGIVNTAATYLLLLLMMRWIAYLAAYTIVYMLGIALGYWLQRRFVFRAKANWRAALKFPFAYVGQYAFGALALWILVDALHASPQISALVVVILTVPVGFVLSRFVFSSSRSPNVPL